MEDQLRILILRHLKGDITLPERNEMRMLLDKSPMNNQVREQMRADWRFSKEAIVDSEIDIEEGLLLIKEKIKIAESKRKKRVNPSKRIKRTGSNTYLLIGLLGLLIIAGTTWWLYKPMPKDIQRELKTGLGESKLHVLPNGTTITLRENSKLNYFANKFKEEQTIELFGSAYVDQPNESLATLNVFINGSNLKIMAADVDIQKRKEAQLHLQVEKGTLAIYGKAQKMIGKLEENQGGNYFINENRFEKDSYFNKNITAWKTGRLQYKRRKLNLVITDMEAYFNKKIILTKKEVGNCSFSGKFDNPDVNAMLSQLASQFKMQLSQNYKGQYVLRGGRCN